jgi:hypothetical protein
MNSVVAMQSTAVQPATAQEIKGQVQRIQQVMRAVMHDKVHYGVVPGTPKPSLWKPGAEVLCATFHIAPSYRVDDLSDHDCIRYRVTCVGTHQGTGIVMGEGMGECSSNEKKYKWRKAYDREYAATDDSRKRIEYGWDREKRQEYEVKQVRTEPADLANTILKMACKRAQVAMTLNVTAASDIFTQDLEDLPPGVDPSDEDRGERQPSRSRKANTKPPQAKTDEGQSGAQAQTGKLNDGQLKVLRKQMDDAGVSDAALMEKFAVGAVEELPFAKLNDALLWIKSIHEGNG